VVVAIDGPAGSGKSTVARFVAETLKFTFINSGSFYRAITLALLRAGTDFSDSAAVLALAETLSLSYQDSHLILNGEDVEHLLHSDEIDSRAASVSAIVPLRHIVNRNIRTIAEGMYIVCEGRDMTTVVFPDAQYKFFLDASVQARALRRYNQGVSSLSLEQIEESIAKRDEIDRNKEEGSLKIAPDAVYLDTSDLTLQQVCEIIICKIQL
jgi:cytidylate kinase